MSSGTDDERRPASEPTFADVMNGFSLDAGRSPRRRRWGRRRDDGVAPPDAPPAEAQYDTPPPMRAHPAQPPSEGAPPPSPRASPPLSPPLHRTPPDPDEAGPAGASAVRP